MKKDIYDYLVTKCDNSVSQAFLTYFVLQSAQSNFITKCDRLLLQIASGITKCGRLLLQNTSGITKCDRLYYKVRQVLQSVAVMTK